MKNLLENTLVYVQARNSRDNSKANPLKGTDFIGTFENDIDQFLISNSNDIFVWTPIPDDYIADSTERQNFIFYIRWSDCQGITPLV